MRTNQGFTLIEIILVMGILAILTAITLLALNPAKQFAQANNTKRRSDVNTILNAVNQYQADNKGNLPAGITNVYKDISSSGANICSQLVSAYIAAFPVDPSVNSGTSITDCAVAYSTGYKIVKSDNDSRITVLAPMVELSASISATR